jgi:hypothetical protein
MTRIQVMVSSRSHDPVSDADQTTLETARRRLKKTIEAVLAQDGRAAFEVWISEEGDPAAADRSSWEECIERARACDILLALFNGHSGWSPKGSSIGICQAELQAAVDSAPEKVRLVWLRCDRTRSSVPEREWDQAFRQYVDRLSIFRGAMADSAEDVVRESMAALRDAVVELTRAGSRSSRLGLGYQGEALDWNRLSFANRKGRMEEVLAEELLERPGSIGLTDREVVVLVSGKPVLACCHAVPAAMTIAGARELVGQPFLRDHEYLAAGSEDTNGPVHIIACVGRVSDAQARRQLGFPDATVVATPFGVWIADPIQKMQLLFLAGCLDSTSTRHQVQRAFAWLSRTGEEAQLLDRAISRARIARAVGAEQIRSSDLSPGGKTATGKRAGRSPVYPRTKGGSGV